MQHDRIILRHAAVGKVETLHGGACLVLNLFSLHHMRHDCWAPQLLLQSAEECPVLHAVASRTYRTDPALTADCEAKGCHLLKLLLGVHVKAMFARRHRTRPTCFDSLVPVQARQLFQLTSGH